MNFEAWQRMTVTAWRTPFAVPFDALSACRKSSRAPGVMWVVRAWCQPDAGQVRKAEKITGPAQAAQGLQEETRRRA